MSTAVSNKESDRSVPSGIVVLRRVEHAKIQTRVEVTLYLLHVSIYLTERVQLTNRLINTSPCFPRGTGTHKPYKDVYRYVCVCVVGVRCASGIPGHTAIMFENHQRSNPLIK